MLVSDNAQDPLKARSKGWLFGLGCGRFEQFCVGPRGGNGLVYQVYFGCVIALPTLHERELLKKHALPPVLYVPCWFS